MRRLPPQFADLSLFVAKWALDNERDRFFALTGSTLQELRVFHDAMLPRGDAIVEYLNAFPVDQLPEDARTLMDLATTFVEVGHPIDLKWRFTDIEDSFPSSKMDFVGPSAPKSDGRNIPITPVAIEDK